MDAFLHTLSVIVLILMAAGTLTYLTRHQKAGSWRSDVAPKKKKKLHRHVHNDADPK